MMEAPGVHIDSSNPPVSEVEDALSDYASIDEVVLRPSNEHRVYHFSDLHAAPFTESDHSRVISRVQVEKAKSIQTLSEQYCVGNYVIEGICPFHPVGNAIHSRASPQAMQEDVLQRSVNDLTSMIQETGDHAEHLTFRSLPDMVHHGGEDYDLFRSHAVFIKASENLRRSQRSVTKWFKHVFGKQTEAEKLEPANKYCRRARTANFAQNTAEVANQRGNTASSLGGRHTGEFKSYVKSGEAAVNGVPSTEYHSALPDISLDLPVDNIGFVFLTPNSYDGLS